jgi:Skp family chaperone for outer membrane proteins
MPISSIFSINFYKNTKMTKLAQRFAVSTIAAALAAFGLFAGPAQAQKAYGVVDVNAVVTSMPEYVAANQKIEAQRKIYMDTITSMQTTYKAKQDAYANVGESATADYKKKAQADLDNLNQQFNTFREAKFGQEGELAKLQAQLMKPITDKLQNTLATYAKKEHLTMILPKTATVYVDESLDLTTKFQTYLTAQDAK